MVRMVPKGDVVVGGMGLGAPVMNGAFSFNQVPPGAYTLTVRVGSEGGFGRFRPGSDGPDDTELAIVPVTVAGEDLSNVRVVTSRGLTVSGIVVAEGAALPADPPLRVMVVPTDGEMMMGVRPSTVDAGGRFQIEGVMGEGRLSVMGIGRGWMLKSVDYKGANVTDKPIEFSGDGGPIRVTITNRIPIVTGTVTAGNGAPVTDYEVLLFTTDAAQWEKPGRTVRALRADQQGGFRAEGLPAGDYYIAAFAGLDEETRTSAEVLERARGVAQQITLVEGQTRTLALRLSILPQQ
jgi:Carboxypeptidase regulatory-like domain